MKERRTGNSRLLVAAAVLFLGWRIRFRPGWLDFAVKLTRTPEECGQSDLARLREAGFTDEDILHIIEVTAIFNHNVRLATATGLFPIRSTTASARPR